MANRIDALALRQGTATSWLGLTLVRERDWIIQPVGSDLYGGTLGIAFFLAYLADVTGNRAHDRLARDVVAQVVPRIRLLVSPEERDAPVTPGSLGAFGSLGGAIYVLSHLGLLWRDHDLLRVADALAVRVRGDAAVDRHLDIIGGVAGLIFALHALQRARDYGAAHEVMCVSADRLLEAAQSTDSGLAWNSLLASTRPLTGFSHGASGIGAALFTAGSVLNDCRYSAAAFGAFEYERSTFDAARRNWPDYRILDRVAPADLTSMMWSWCHGAPGIGLARLLALQYGELADTSSELETAILSTIHGGFGSNDSLCHGDLGNLELLVRAKELDIDGPWSRHLGIESSRLVNRIGRGEWRCGIPGGVETPGLMMGLAGIGYGLLRLGATERVPSLLSLEAPRGEPLAGSSQ